MRKTFAELLRKYRGDRTQGEMAAFFDITPMYYSELERGKKKPSMNLFLQIVQKTDVDASFWLPMLQDANEEHEKSLFQKIPASSIQKDLSRYSIPEIILLISELRVYLANLDKDALAEPDRRLLSDSLAACQRTMSEDDNEFGRAIG